MVHASLFTGIGGFDLAAEWCGWENSFQCEIDPFCQKVLAKNFPHADRYTDIKQFNATPYAGRVDVLSGGFPCQTYSLAGLGAMDADLWLQMLRIIGECSPRWVVAENVLGFAQRKQGLALERVCADLEAAGYSVFPPLILPAAAIGAPPKGSASGLLPTPTANDEKNNQAYPAHAKRKSPPLATVLARRLGAASGYLNPRYTAQMMGYPAGWCDL
jgi:hypothetical protein